MAGWKDPVKEPVKSFIPNRPDLPGPPVTPPTGSSPIPPPVIPGDPDYVVAEE